MKAFLKTILIVAIIIVVVVTGSVIVFLYKMDLLSKDYTIAELKTEFIKAEPEIHNLRSYLKEIIPKNSIVTIEFDNEKTIGRLEYSIQDSFQNGHYTSVIQEWDLRIGSQNTDSLINIIGWSNRTLEEIKDRLDRANCIGISNGEPIEVFFKRHGMCMYTFILFEDPIPNNLKSIYNDSCSHILVNNKMVLGFGGGVLGPQCFYNF